MAKFLSDEEIQFLAEQSARAHEERMQDPEFRKGWDEAESLFRRARERDEAVARAEDAEAEVKRIRRFAATFMEKVDATRQALDALDREIPAVDDRLATVTTDIRLAFDNLKAVLDLPESL